MKTLSFSTTIQATRQTVWTTMLAPDTYKQLSKLKALCETPVPCA